MEMKFKPKDWGGKASETRIEIAQKMLKIFPPRQGT